MIDLVRLAECAGRVPITQSALAERVGMSQQAMWKVFSGETKRTRYLQEIARELNTTPDYLLGKTDNPSATASPGPPPLPYQAVTMQVLLPAEDALVRMFEALLAMVDPSASPEEQARSLAKNLPIGLSQLRDLLPSSAPVARATPRRVRSKTLVEPQ